MQSLDALLPPLDVAELSRQAKALPGYRTFIGSGLVFCLALVGRFLALLLRVQRGESVAWLGPFLHMTGLALLLRHYSRIMPRAIEWTTLLVLPTNQPDSLTTLSTIRASALDAFLAERGAVLQWTFTWAEAENFALVLSSVLLQLGCTTSIVVLRGVQLFLFAVLTTVGPFVLAFSLFGGPLAVLARVWALALVEVSSWSWMLALVTVMFAPVLLHTTKTEPFSLVTDIAISSLLLSLLFAIPLCAAALFRGQSARAARRNIAQATREGAATMFASLPTLPAPPWRQRAPQSPAP